MFQEDDFSKAKDFESTIPDGIMDGSVYLNKMKQVTETILSADPDGYSDRVLVMMKIINHCFANGDDGDFSVDNTMNTVIALTFHIMTLMGIGSSMDDRFLDEYKNHIAKVITKMEETSDSVPYWGDIQDD